MIKLDENRPTGRVVLIITKKGRILEGMRLGENTFYIQLIDANDRLYTIAKAIGAVPESVLYERGACAGCGDQRAKVGVPHAAPFGDRAVVNRGESGLWWDVLRLLLGAECDHWPGTLEVGYRRSYRCSADHIPRRRQATSHNRCWQRAFNVRVLNQPRSRRISTNRRVVRCLHVDGLRSFAEERTILSRFLRDVPPLLVGPPNIATLFKRFVR